MAGPSFFFVLSAARLIEVAIVFGFGKRQQACGVCPHCRRPTARTASMRPEDRQRCRDSAGVSLTFLPCQLRMVGYWPVDTTTTLYNADLSHCRFLLSPQCTSAAEAYPRQGGACRRHRRSWRNTSAGPALSPGWRRWLRSGSLQRQQRMRRQR